MNQEEIRKILPHRDHMLLLEDVTEQDGMAIGHYTVRGDEFFLKGHFPEYPIVPGVILCEIMAQSACVLLQDRLNDKKIPVYTGLNNVKFRSPVRPGDRVEAKCKITRSRYPFYFAEGTITVEDRICASADFSFAITGA